MALRTTSTAVQEKLGRNFDGKTGLKTFMKSANVMTNAIVRCASAKGVTITDEQLEEIETLLACHYYQRADPGFSSKTTGRSSASFHGQTGTRIDSTFYGQDAIGMDPSGCLASFSNGGRVGMIWLGKPKSDQIDYADRN